MKINAIIQARMGSNRLPGKTLKKVGDKTLLEILIARIKRSKKIDQIIVATTEKEQDDPIIDLAVKLNIKYFRGHEKNVLQRFVETLKVYQSDIIVRLTADNPLTSPKLVDQLIELHIRNKLDYTYGKNIPLGTIAEIINAHTLQGITQEKLDVESKEHVTYYIVNHRDKYKVYFHDFKYDTPDIRLTVDTKEDFKLMRELYNHLGDLTNLSINEIILFLRSNPEIRKINAGIIQKKADPNFNFFVSIIIRTYNSANFVKSSIESALQQTLPSLYYETLIFDDGSVDETKEILKSFQIAHPEILRVIFREHKGPIKTLNDAIKAAKGNLIVILDSDDEFKPNLLEKMVKVHQKKYFDFVYSDYIERNMDTQIEKYIDVKYNLFFTVAAGIMFRKEKIIEVGLYDENLIFPEYDLLLKCLESKSKYSHIAEPLFIYNRRPRSITSDESIVKKGLKQLEKKWGKIVNIRSY